MDPCLALEVLNKRHAVDQLLGDSTGESKHGKTSVLKLLHTVFGKFLVRGGDIKSGLEDAGVGAADQGEAVPTGEEKLFGC